MVLWAQKIFPTRVIHVYGTIYDAESISEAHGQGPEGNLRVASIEQFLRKGAWPVVTAA